MWGSFWHFSPPTELKRKIARADANFSGRCTPFTVHCQKHGGRSGNRESTADLMEFKPNQKEVEGGESPEEEKMLRSPELKLGVWRLRAAPKVEQRSRKLQDCGNAGSKLVEGSRPEQKKLVMDLLAMPESHWIRRAGRNKQSCWTCRDRTRSAGRAAPRGWDHKKWDVMGKGGGSEQAGRRKIAKRQGSRRSSTGTLGRWRPAVRYHPVARTSTCGKKPKKPD